VASRIEAPSLLIPAGTPIAAPVSTLLFTTRGTVTELEFLIPPGPSGLVGFAITHSSEQIIPDIPGQWIIADNDIIHWPLNGYSDQPGWRIKGYNLDVYAHTIYVRVLIDDWRPGNGVLAPVVAAEIVE